MQIRWQYCKDLNDINQAIKDYPNNENWEGLYTADNIISINYDTNHGCYVVFWKVGSENRWENVNDTISRQDAIDELYRGAWGVEWDRALAKAMIKSLPPAQPEPKWIPCNEKLPEEEKASYWVCTDAGYQFECRWTNENHLFTNFTMKWHWHVMDVPQYSTVVAWMPLPEPYGGENDG